MKKFTSSAKTVFISGMMYDTVYSTLVRYTIRCFKRRGDQFLYEHFFSIIGYELRRWSLQL